MQEFLDWLSPIWKPHPGQLAFLEARAKTKVLACGRRWGKTDACAVQILSKLTDDKPRRQLIIAPTKAQAKMIYKRIVSLIKRLLNKDLWFQKFIDIPTFRDSDMEITIGHHTICARSAGQKHNLRGDEADHIAVDEAAFVTREVIDEVLSPMMATTDGELTLISTPKGTNHFYEQFSEGIKTDHDKDEFFSLQSPSSDNPMVIANFLEKQKKLLSASAYQTEYEAKFVQHDGYVFSREAVERCVHLEPESEIDGPDIIAIDWARYHDYTALVVLRGHQTRASVLEADRLQRTGWKEQIEWVKSITDRYPNARIVCDTTGVGDGITSWLREELKTKSVKDHTITATNKPQLIDGLVKLIEREHIQLPDYKPLREELDNFEATRSATGHITLAAQCGHDDLVIALALAASDLPYAHRMIMTTGDRRLFRKPPLPSI